MLGYVRTACLALGLVAPTADEPVLRRARGAVAKRLTMTSRHSCFIVLHMCRVIAIISQDKDVSR